MRKQPRQARSRATVAAIVEAGARILGRGGWTAFNTNAVAALAGVSIGTLYQYFPNRLALVEAVRCRHFEEVLAVIHGVASAGDTPRDRIQALVSGMIAVHGASPELHRALLEEAPRGLHVSPAEQAFERAYFAAYERILLQVSRRRKRPALHAGARVLSAAIEGAIHDAARCRALDSTAFRTELEALVAGYLR